MSTVERTAVRHRRRSVVGVAWFAAGILVALLVALAILASGHAAHTTITHSYRVSCPSVRAECPAVGSHVVSSAAPAASPASGSAKREFLVDPGSGFAVRARP